MGILIQDETVNQNGIKVKDTYGSFSDGINVKKVVNVTVQETTQVDSSNNNGWSVKEPVLDSNGNRSYNEITDSSGNIIDRILNTESKYFKHVEKESYKLSGRFIIYLSKEIRELSHSKVYTDRHNYPNNYRAENSKRYNSLTNYNVSVESENCNDIYKKLYDKLKSMNLFTNYSDDL